MKKGFTLIELAVVIAVMGVLVLFLNFIVTPDRNLTQTKKFEKIYSETLEDLYYKAQLETGIPKPKKVDENLVYYSWGASRKSSNLMYVNSYTDYELTNICGIQPENEDRLNVTIEYATETVTKRASIVLYPFQYRNEMTVSGDDVTFVNPSMEPVIISNMDMKANTDLCRKLFIIPAQIPIFNKDKLSSARFFITSSESQNACWCIEASANLRKAGIFNITPLLIPSGNNLGCLGKNIGANINCNTGGVYVDLTDYEQSTPASDVFRVFLAKKSADGQLVDLQDIKIYGVFTYE